MVSNRNIQTFDQFVKEKSDLLTEVKDNGRNYDMSYTVCCGVTEEKKQEMREKRRIYYMTIVKSNASKHLVSVIIPTYKRETVKKAVDSVLRQDYPNIEIIVVDDNAEYPEYRQKVIDSLSEYVVDGKIMLLQNDRNLGGAFSRNAGIEVSHGEYIAFFDDDDLFLQGKLTKQVEVLDSSDAALVYCFCVGKNADGNVVWENRKNKEGNLLFEAMTECIANTSLIMCRREPLLAVGMFSDAPCKQDVLLELKLASNGYKFKCVPEILVEYGHCQEDFKRLCNIKKTTLIGFNVVRDYGREHYDKLTPSQINEVELDTSYKMCLIAEKIGEREVIHSEFRNMLRQGVFDIRTFKVLIKCVV